jgi:hypothetical protein
LKNHRVFIVRNNHLEWSYDHFTPDSDDNALELPVLPGDVIVDGAGLDPVTFDEFHKGALRRLFGHEPKKLYELLDEGARVTVPADAVPAEPDHETVYQVEFRRVVSRPTLEALDAAAALTRLDNARERRQAAVAGREPVLRDEPVRAYFAVVQAEDGTPKRRAVFPAASLVHVFAGGSPDLATADAHAIKPGETLVGRKGLGSGRPGAAPTVRLGGNP